MNDTIQVHRYAALDGARGVAALLIVVDHFDAPWHGQTLAIVMHLRQCVTFFFVLSGFVIAYAYIGRIKNGRDIAWFALRRFGRLWPLHIAVLSFFVLKEVGKLAVMLRPHHPAMQGAFTGTFSVPALIANIALVQSWWPKVGTWNGPSWSISAEFWTNIIFGFVALSPRFSRVALYLLALMAGTAMMWLSAQTGAIDYTISIFPCLQGFFLGVFVYQVRRQMTHPPSAPYTLFEFAIVAITIVAMRRATSVVADIGMPFLFAVLVFVFSMQRGLISKWLLSKPGALLGEWSYSIYLTHMLLVVVLIAGPAKLLPAQSPWIWDAAFVVFLAITLIVSRLTYRLVELPWRKRINASANKLKL